MVILFQDIFFHLVDYLIWGKNTINIFCITFSKYNPAKTGFQFNSSSIVPLVGDATEGVAALDPVGLD